MVYFMPILIFRDNEENIFFYLDFSLATSDLYFVTLELKKWKRNKKYLLNVFLNICIKTLYLLEKFRDCLSTNISYLLFIIIIISFILIRKRFF